MAVRHQRCWKYVQHCLNPWYCPVPSQQLHCCMCAFMTLAPMDLEASCRPSCDDDENGSSSIALRSRNRHFMVEGAWCILLIIIVLVIVFWCWCDCTRHKFAGVEPASWPRVHRRSGGPRARLVAAGWQTQDRYEWEQQGGLSFWQ